MKTQLCISCNIEIRKCNYSKHINACRGKAPQKKKLEVCTHCESPLDGLSASLIANHVRWCKNNPKREQYITGTAIARSYKPAVVSNTTKEKISAAHNRGCYAHVDHSTMKGKKHTEEAKRKMSAGALKSKHRRLVRSTRLYICKNGTEVLLDSSWEEALAKRLDELNIAWIRPEVPIPWTDHNGKKHNYFPDFLLTDHNIYLDPKNPIAYNVQRAKIDIITKQLNNLIILKTLKECQEFNVFED